MSDDPHLPWMEGLPAVGLLVLTPGECQAKPEKHLEGLEEGQSEQ